MTAGPPELAHQRINESDPLTIDCWINYRRPVTNLAETLLAVIIPDLDIHEHSLRPIRQDYQVLTLIGRVTHSTRDLAENRADARRHTGHDGARGDGDKARHQGIFDEV